MMNLIKILLTFLMIYTIVSCDKNDEDENQAQNNKAIAVYNQAYQENYEADKVNNIIEKANNAYILIDPFEDNVSASISALKANGNEVGAYISIGTGENWRDDFSQMEQYLVSTSWGQWPDEFFVSVTTTGIVDIMKARIDKIATWGCDWVEFDNMDWVYDDDLRATYGFQVSQAEGVAYYQELCDYVHQKGMKCMAKNMTEDAENFDGVLYESYNDEKNWWNQSGAQSFLDAGKLVVINHYNETNCGQVYSDYKEIYNENLSFICEDANLKKYAHFNE